MNMSRTRLGQVLMGLWFIITGAVAVLGLSFAGIAIILGVFATS